MSPECPKNCSSKHKTVRFGQFFRKSDSKFIKRWKCNSCHSTFSAATSNPCFAQKKRRLNPIIYQKIIGKTSQRRIAKLLKINRKTVARKITFLGLRCKQRRLKWLNTYNARKVQFDDLITFEHTKCKPLAVSVFVEEETRKILDFEISRMAANGLLARKSRKKYGLRKDERKEKITDLFLRAQDYILENSELKSDEHPFYPGLVRKYFPKSTHQRFKGRKACVAGQGELKAGGFDPLFDLNHTFAMIRDGLNCLVRRTWCTTKKLEGLRSQLEIYIDVHNRLLT